MAKQTGLGAALYYAGYDIGGDTQSFTLHGGPAPLDVTDITQSGYGRLGGLRTAEIQWTSYMDPAALASHAALSPLPTTDQIATVFLPALAIGSPALSQQGKQLSYDPTRQPDGMLTFAISGLSSGFGQEWGVALTAGKRVDSAATNGTSNDFLVASPSFGAQAYLQVFAFTGTDVTVKLQDSADNASFADVVGGGFTQITTAPQAQRIATANNLQIRRYVRAVTVTTGGFTTVTFAVQISVNTVSVVF